MVSSRGKYGAGETSAAHWKIARRPRIVAACHANGAILARLTVTIFWTPGERNGLDRHEQRVYQIAQHPRDQDRGPHLGDEAVKAHILDVVANAGTAGEHLHGD